MRVVAGARRLFVVGRSIRVVAVSVPMLSKALRKRVWCRFCTVMVLARVLQRFWAVVGFVTTAPGWCFRNGSLSNAG